MRRPTWPASTGRHSVANAATPAAIATMPAEARDHEARIALDGGRRRGSGGGVAEAGEGRGALLEEGGDALDGVLGIGAGVVAFVWLNRRPARHMDDPALVDSTGTLPPLTGRQRVTVAIIGAWIAGVLVFNLNLGLSAGGELGAPAGGARALGGSRNPIAELVLPLLAVAAVLGVLLVRAAHASTLTRLSP